MSVNFDFNQGNSLFRSANTPLTTTGNGGFTVTNTDGGVRFTLSYTGNFPASGIFPNFVGLPGLYIGTESTLGTMGSSTYASFSFSFAKTATTSQNLLSGNATNPLKLGFSVVAGSWVARFYNASLNTVVSTNLTGAGSVTVTGTHQITRVTFSTSTGGDLRISSLSGNALNCFLEGTLVDTPTGKRRVETLSAGDVVSRSDGGVTTVKWLGFQNVDTALMHPKLVNPICIKAGALGADLPERDLYLSQDHAIAIDGVLYNAGALVNGQTIYQVTEMPREGFTYYHIETEAHELLHVEGLAAESFIDYAGRDGFDNDETPEDAVSIEEMPLPRVSSARMVPAPLRAFINRDQQRLAG